MTRSYFLVLLGIILIGSSLNVFSMIRTGNDSLNLKLSIPTFKVDHVGPFQEILTHQDFNQTLKPGYAVLPFKEVNFIIPFGKEVKSIEVVRSQLVLIDDFNFPMRGNGMRPYSLKGKKRDISHLKQGSQLKFYPESMTADHFINQTFHQVNFYQFNIYPVFKESDNQFYQAKETDITVHFKNIDRAKNVGEEVNPDKLDSILSLNNLQNVKALNTYKVRAESLIDDQ